MHRLYFLCLLFFCVESQNLYNIKSVMEMFTLKEKELWKDFDYHDLNNETRNEAKNKFMKFYEHFMSNDFEEIGIFQMISKEWSSNFHQENIVKHMKTVNDSFEHVFHLMKNKPYDDLMRYALNNYKNESLFPYMYHFQDEDFWKSLKNETRFCGKDVNIILAETQVLREFYKEFLANVMKCYMINQFSNIIRAFAIYADRARNDLWNIINKVEDAFHHLIQTDNVTRESREMWACDPNNFKDKNSFIEIPMLYQGFIANELNLNSQGNCRQTCPDYTNSRQFNCNVPTYCSKNYSDKTKSQCNGLVQNCIKMDDVIAICEEPTNSTRRYDFIKYGNGNVIGVEKHCWGRIEIKSHWDWFYKCDNCLCYCNEEVENTHLHKRFSLRDVTADINQNKIVSGVGIIKVNDVIQLQISQRPLLPRGVLNTIDDQNNSNWITSAFFNFTDKNLKEGEDYTTITWENRSIALTSATIEDNEHVVTGVRFCKYNNHIGIEIRATRFNFETGHLTDLENSRWIRNSNVLSELKLHEPDVPTKSLEKSHIFPENNKFIKFQPTDIYKDGAQATVPFLDLSPLEAYIPLSGVGLYYKSTPGYGGFLASKLIVYDFGSLKDVFSSNKMYGLLSRY